jgi:heptosyltransferase-3
MSGHSGPTRPPRKPHRRLLIRPGGIGDCIVTLPTMEALCFGETTVWITTSLLPVALAHPSFRDARCVVAAGLFLFGYTGNEHLAETCRELSQFDSVYSWYSPPSDSAERQAILHAAPHVQFLPSIPPVDSTMHATDFHLQQAAPFLGGNLPLPVPCLTAYAQRERVVTFQPFASRPSKEWPLANFLALESLLLPHLPVQWIVDPQRLPLPFSPVGRVFSLSDLSVIAGRIAASSMFIGNDSGISHLAAAVGTPAVVLFGETNPHIWSPRGRNPVTVLQAPGGSLPAITPAEVAEKVRHYFAL